ncbi:MAG: 4Fe-4S binding protein [Acidobacteria bacterium]|nr:4Fe-4S binding protein [Acidobacteriota bacterium]
MSDASLYRRLQQDLDRMPVGFPATESGVEIRILEQLFTEEDARIALSMSMAAEPVAAIGRRLDPPMDLEVLSMKLEDMAHRGLIRRTGSAEELKYGKMPFVVGIYEGQVNRMSERLAVDLIEYFEHGLGEAVRPKKTTQLRTVPVNQTIPVEREVGRYDDLRQYVRSTDGPFAVMNCICRQAKDLAGDPCRQTQVRENCLTLGGAAKVMVDHGQARYITRERMLELIDEADLEGLVVQPQNTREPMFVCLCCGCCCVALGTGKRHERPVEFFNSNFYVRVTAEDCEGCGECVHRCQMDAVTMDGGVASIELARCIGCGLCVSTCTSGAMELQAKTDGLTPPGSTAELYAKIYLERYGALGFARAALRIATRAKV